MKTDFKAGDRVKSRCMGYYYGAEGTLIKPSQTQYGKFTRFIVELDTGKVITLPANWIEDTEE
jgi:hypothetical protein